LPLPGRETGQILALCGVKYVRVRKSTFRGTLGYVRIRFSTSASRMQILFLTYRSFEHVQTLNRISRIPQVQS